MGYVIGIPPFIGTHSNGTDNIGLAYGPDLPLSELSEEPQTIKFIIEHRSALNGKKITAHGIVVSGSSMGRPICDKNEICQRHASLADNRGSDRDMNYDMPIIINPDDPTPYNTGETVDIVGTVAANKDVVTLYKE